MSDPPTVDVVTTVARRRVMAGTKQERTALVADIDGRTFVLRRRGAPAFTEDPELAALVGTRVAMTGTPLTTVFLVDRVTQA